MLLFLDFETTTFVILAPRTQQIKTLAIKSDNVSLINLSLVTCGRTEPTLKCSQAMACMRALRACECMCVCPCTHTHHHKERNVIFFKKKINVGEGYEAQRHPGFWFSPVQISTAMPQVHSSVTFILSCPGVCQTAFRCAESWLPIKVNPPRRGQESKGFRKKHTILLSSPLAWARFLCMSV